MHPGFLLTRPCHINNSARRNETLSRARPIRIPQAGSREPVQAASFITGRCPSYSALIPSSSSTGRDKQTSGCSVDSDG